MATLKQRLEAEARGEVAYVSGGREAPVYDEEDMRCVKQALQNFLRRDKAAEGHSERHMPPSLALPLIL